MCIIEDTRYYWRLSPHIFRYNHNNALALSKNGVHTVNECKYYIATLVHLTINYGSTVIEIDSFLEMIRFFVTLILNADESKAM